MFPYWQDLQYDYSGRDLTKQDDRAAAILGLGKALGPLLKSEFVAGVWSGDWLLESLCWANARRSF